MNFCMVEAAKGSFSTELPQAMLQEYPPVLALVNRVRPEKPGILPGGL